MVQNLEKTRAIVRNSVSRASTISAEECQLTLTEEDFMAIQGKMNKINQRLDELYKNWHAEYRDAVSTEDCEEIKRFYKPYLEKYESKYRILYHLLHQSMSFPTQDPTSEITPSLAALDDAQTLRRIRDEPGEDTPWWYSSTSGHLTLMSPRHEDTRLDPSLHVTPEGSLSDLPTAVSTEEAREIGCQMSEERIQGTPCKTSVKETSDTRLKLIPESNMRETPRRIQRTREASREDAIASTRWFFPTVHERRRGANVDGPIVTSSDRNENDVCIASNVPATPDVPETEATETEVRSSRSFLPNESPPRPTATATCRPRTWVQCILEGQINEPTPDDACSSESDQTGISAHVEEIPEELGCEWRVLHPFKVLGVQFPTDATQPNQRRLAENDALVGLIQTTKYLEDTPMWGQRDY